MPYGFLGVFEVQPIAQAPVTWKNWQEDEALKEQFGIALEKSGNAFEAGCIVFGKETNKALWVSKNWINDPVVLKTKEDLAEIAQDKKSLLDKSELSLTLLEFSKERVEFNGNVVYAAEAKDRLKALELYAKIQGFINDKPEINNNFTKNNVLQIEFVEAEKKETVKTIDATPIEHEDILEASPIKLQLVG